jgi:hypothetical protein
VVSRAISAARRVPGGHSRPHAAHSRRACGPGGPTRRGAPGEADYAATEPFRSCSSHAITFGLIIEDGHGTDWAELYPDRLGFHSPWDGSYDT